MTNTAIAAPPQSIRTAVNLVWALVGLSVLALVLTVVMRDQLIESWAQASGSYGDMYDDGGADAVSDYAPAFVPIAIISTIIFGGIMALLAIFLRRGAGWARIVLTVLAVLGVLGALTTFAQHRPALFLVLTVVQLALYVGLLVFLWHRDSSAYLKGRRTQV